MRTLVAISIHPDHVDTVERVLEGLAAIGVLERRSVVGGRSAQAAQTATCGICHEAFDAIQRITPPAGSLLPDIICPLCHGAAHTLETKLRSAIERHSANFRGQLVQMVRDVRSGLEEPTFYAGFE